MALTAPTAPTLLDLAISYRRRGWLVVPIPYRQKGPVLPDWPDLRLGEDELPQHFNGRPQNIGVLLGEPSGGLVDIDLDDPEAVPWAERLLPPTEAVFGRASSPRSHWLYRVPGFAPVSLFKPILELRSTREQTVFPGSTHRDTGELIEGEHLGDPAPVAGEYLVRRCAMVAIATQLAPFWREGLRHEVVLDVAGVLARAEWPEGDVLALIGTLVEHLGGALRPAEATVRDTFREYTAGRPVSGFDKVAERIDPGLARDLRKWFGEQWRRAKGKLLLLDDGTDLCSDVANAARFIRDFGESVRYGVGVGWLRWGRTHWEAVDDVAMLPLPAETARGIHHEAAETADRDDQKRLAQHASASQSLPRLRAMLTLAAGSPDLRVKPDALDAHPLLCNVRNGTLDVRTGTVRPHNPDDLLTSLIDETYDPDARHHDWNGFLNRIFDGNTALIDWVQRALGYSCCTGSIAEECLFIAWGSGANGKSTLLGTVTALLGESLARTVSMGAFLEQRQDSPGNDIAQLRGARLALSSEPRRGGALNMERLKGITGGEKISARRLYHDAVNFLPTFKLWISTNDKPAIRGQDEGTWRRLRLIPFAVQIPEAERDRDMKRRFRETPKIRRAVLAWLVAGAMRWAAEGGLGDNTDVGRATDRYRAESDDVRRFVADCCQRGPDFFTTSLVLFRAYGDWAKAEGGGPFPLTRGQFVDELGRLGFLPHKRNGQQGRKGLRLRSDAEDPTSAADPF